jgi:site-specific DNA-methyltransferase (adenine-specific)
VDSNRIVNCDALEFLSTVPDNSVDLIITDPPYFIKYDGGKGWDNQWSSEREYLNFCAEWSKECVRVLKPNRMFIVWGTLKTNTFLKYKLETEESNNELVGQNEIIWSYNWGGRSKANFARKHEYAWCFSKGKTFLFNADDVRVERKMKVNPRNGLKFTNGTIPTSIWEKNNHTTSKDFIGWHPTTKNIDVLDRMIRAYSNPGDVVLDIFLGSGSTALAANRAGRVCIGSEKDNDYFFLMLERLKNV